MHNEKIQSLFEPIRKFFCKVILLDIDNDNFKDKVSAIEEKMDMAQEKIYALTYLPAFGDFRKMIRNLWICLGISMLIIGTITEFLTSLISIESKFNIFKVPWSALCNLKEVLIFAFFLYLAWALYNYSLTRKPMIDEERGFEYAATNECGSMRPLIGDAYDKCIVEVDIKDAKSFILGYGKRDPQKVCCVRETKAGSRPILSNPHIAACGGSGAGKSYSLARPAIYNAITAGKSYIVTETSGELYQDTSEIARKHGYDVKLLNYIPDSIEFSDSCNYIIQIINGNSSKAATLATVILENTAETRGFWDDAQKNILTALLLLIDGSKDLPDDRKNLGTLMDYVSEGPEKLCARINALPPSHPAKRYGQLFVHSEGKVKESAVFGLGVRLQIFLEPKVRNAVRYNEVSLTAPGERKCAYYVNISDTESTYQVLSALFFNYLLIELGNLARKQRDKIKLPVPVDLILDEFTNIGILKDFEKTISTVRKYGISIFPIFQDIGQMQVNYPNTYSSILANCAMNMYMGGNDVVVSAEYYSKLFGVATVIDTSESKPINVLMPKVPKLYVRQQVRTKARPIYMEDEVLGLNSDYVIIKLERQGPLKLRKFSYKDHPLYQEEEKCSIYDHVPEWKRELMVASYVQEEKKSVNPVAKNDTAKNVNVETDKKNKNDKGCTEGKVLQNEIPYKTVKPINETDSDNKQRNTVKPLTAETPKKEEIPKTVEKNTTPVNPTTIPVPKIPVPKGTNVIRPKVDEEEDDDLMLKDTRIQTGKKPNSFKDF